MTPATPIVLRNDEHEELSVNVHFYDPRDSLAVHTGSYIKYDL